MSQERESPASCAAAPDEAQDIDGAADAIERYRNTLKQAFPMPDVASLAPSPRKGKVIAALLATIALAGLIWIDPGWRWESHRTAAAERSLLTLSDDSRITLDAQTVIVVVRHLRSRRVELVSGRALFDVAPARWRPFMVDAGAAQVRVTGTVFDVRRDDARVGVTVSQGSVQVHAPATGGHVLLGAGEGVEARDGLLGDPVQVDAQALLAWAQGRLEFERRPLGEVLDELRRYRLAPIVLAGPELAELRVSGVFDSDHVEQVLRLLPDILPVRVDVAGDGAATISPR